MSTARRHQEAQGAPQRGDEGLSTKDDTRPLGRLLVDAGVVTREVVDAALNTQRRTFRPLGRILREEHHLSPQDLAHALRQQGSVPRVFLRFFPIKVEAVRLLDRRLCAEQEMIAFERLGELLCVAFSSPARRELLLQLHTQTGFEIAAYNAPWEDIQKALKDHA